MDEDIVGVFKSIEGKRVGPPLCISKETNINQLNELLNKILENNVKIKYRFEVEKNEILKSIKEDVIDKFGLSCEDTIEIVYEMDRRMEPSTMPMRSMSVLKEHESSVLCARFSPIEKKLVSGSGDKTIIFWDVDMGVKVMGSEIDHKGWIQTVSWSKNGSFLVSGDMNGMIQIWTVNDGKIEKSGNGLYAHEKSIMEIDWRPIHLGLEENLFVTCSRDKSSKVFNADSKSCKFVMSGHADAISSVKWTGTNIIATSSHDKTINFYDGSNGQHLSTLRGHSHWINRLTINSDFMFYSISQKNSLDTYENLHKTSKIEFNNFLSKFKHELIASASDDTHAIIWKVSSTTSSPMFKLSKHQAAGLDIRFSPNAEFIATASMDRSVIIWNALNGQLIATFVSHISPVFQVVWSPDNRFLASAGEDSIIKIWDVNTQKLKKHLPGHQNAIYTLDWSLDGSILASGGKDTTVRLWGV